MIRMLVLLGMIITLTGCGKLDGKEAIEQARRCTDMGMLPVVAGGFDRYDVQCEAVKQN